MSRLEVLFVENFKSWRGRQVIGPFKRFTCIIGPNGSGNSGPRMSSPAALGQAASCLRKHEGGLKAWTQARRSPPTSGTGWDAGWGGKRPSDSVQGGLEVAGASSRRPPGQPSPSAPAPRPHPQGPDPRPLPGPPTLRPTAPAPRPSDRTPGA